MKIARLHYITQQGPQGESHAQMVEKACMNGIDWVQLRMKNASDTELLEQALEAQQICARYQAKLIINDRVDIASKINAHGVHLGKDDMPVKQARAILGNKAIICGTANDLQTMIDLAESGADYIGLGPFKFTHTKEKLSPELGLQGYENLIHHFEDLGYTTPIVAIGGITPQDIKVLFQKGIYGVAMAAAINFAPNISEQVKAIQITVDQWKN